MADDKLTEDFKWFMETWIHLKKKANDTNEPNDWKFYVFFLTEAKRNFTKIYATMTNEKWIEFMGIVLKDITCNLKEINIKYKKEVGI